MYYNNNIFYETVCVSVCVCARKKNIKPNKIIDIICCGLSSPSPARRGLFVFGCIQFHGASKLFTEGLRVAKHRLHHRRCGEINIKCFEIYEVERIKKKE